VKIIHLASAALALALTAGAASAQTKACTPIPPGKIGLQLYSVRQVLTPKPPLRGVTPAGRIDEVFGGLNKMGYRYAERFSGTFGQPLEIYEDLADRNGLAMVGSHDDLTPANWGRMLDNAKALHQRYIGSGTFGNPGLKTLEDTLKTAENLNVLGKAAAARGLKFYVHNHEAEFSTKYSYDLKKTGHPEMVSAWEIIAANTNPKWVHFEIDIHWARRGIGLDHPDELYAFLRKHRSRIELLHVKDTAPNGDFADLGQGTTDWPAVFRAAGPQIRWYLWERDTSPNPMQSAQIAYRYLRCQG